jgi:hypothetical protein
LTEPSALKLLATLPNATVRISDAKVIDRPGFYPLQTYHPKLFLFDSRDSTGYVVGSANLTDSALIRNTEIVVAGTESPKNSTWDQVWKDLNHSTDPLTDALLARYAEKWERPQSRPVSPETQPRKAAIDPGNIPVYWDAVTDGGVDPRDFAQFWIEAGSMSSGGSHNQLELPRGANRYFGYKFSKYENEHAEIGTPTLTIAGHEWTNRKLTWHGNNRMERMNLPTASQGGFEYAHTAILFRRNSKGFEIHVVPWDDDAAAAWKFASIEKKLVFRLGEKGGRVCGLF